MFCSFHHWKTKCVQLSVLELIMQFRNAARKAVCAKPGCSVELWDLSKTEENALVLFSLVFCGQLNILMGLNWKGQLNMQSILNRN